MSTTPRPTETAPVRICDLLDMASQRLKQEMRYLEIEEAIADLRQRIEQLERAYGVE